MNMIKWIVIAVLCCFTTGTAFADVSNEVVVGLEGDSTSKVESSTGVDLNGKLETSNSLFTVQYTHFFTPLKDDDKPIDLRRFYQHPSTLSAGLAFIGSTDKDSTVPAAVSDGKGNASMLLLGGEFFLPTNTGFFLNIGGGSGTFKETIGGTAQPDVDIKLGMFELGVRQYIGQSAELHVRFHSESTESTPSGQPKDTSDRSVAYLGARGVMADVVGLMLELGGGKLEDKTGGLTFKSDIGAVNFEIAGYIGKQLTLRLAITAEEEKMTGTPAGVEHKTTTARTTLAGRYWFSERFGMELPLYAESIEQKDTFPVIGEQTLKTTNSGIGLYAAFRF
jgi:hypothetical protein